MVRRYNEPVEVKASAGRPVSCAELDQPVIRGQPEAFIWRGRLYVVREVLAHWRERRAWWREALDPPLGQPHGIAAAARERQVWRVEASPGRLARSGVFDLARDDPPEPADPDTGPPDQRHDQERHSWSGYDRAGYDRADPASTPGQGSGLADSGSRTGGHGSAAAGSGSMPVGPRSGSMPGPGSAPPGPGSPLAAPGPAGDGSAPAGVSDGYEPAGWQLLRVAD